MNGQQALGFVCAHQDVIGPALATLIPVGVFSQISAWTDKMPPWLAHIVNFLGANWGDIVRALTSNSATSANTGAK